MPFSVLPPGGPVFWTTGLRLHQVQTITNGRTAAIYHVFGRYDPARHPVHRWCVVTELPHRFTDKPSVERLGPQVEASIQARDGVGIDVKCDLGSGRTLRIAEGNRQGARLTPNRPALGGDV